MLQWLVLLAWLPAGQAANGPPRFHPASPDYVVLQIPADFAAKSSSESRDDLAMAARDPSRAESTASRLIALARSTREPRYFGRAEAILDHWIGRQDSPPSLLLLKADILQQRHDFTGALDLLDRGVATDPRNTQARLMRATVLMVRGEPQLARTDCAALLALGEQSIGTICLAQSMADSGELSRAIAIAQLVLSRGEIDDTRTLAWTHSSLADFESRRGSLGSAEQHWRAALAAAPDDELVRCSLSDILIARGAASDALELLNLPRPSVAVLVRRAMAQSVLRETVARTATQAQLDELLQLEARRGERVHLREEALFALASGRPATESLQLARKNFSIQREPIDARLLARAATAAHDSAALEELRGWRARTGFKDRRVDELLGSEPS